MVLKAELLIREVSQALICAQLKGVLIDGHREGDNHAGGTRPFLTGDCL